jgi:HCOMODA/2-hydroxy-3-carboxy-muconic semialdehyde decarboxylase
MSPTITPGAPSDEDQRQVRCAARALACHGLAHAYGPLSLRLDAQRFLVCAPRPMGLIAAGEQGHVIGMEGPLAPGVLAEVRVHREIYRIRPDVGGIVRAMPPRVMSLSTMRRTPRMVHGMSSYFSGGVPLWDDPQLVRSDEGATALARLMGQATAVVMRGNGAIIAGHTLPAALALTWYLEDAARIEIDCAACGAEPVLLDEEQALRRATREGRIFERMWEFLVAGDIESLPEPGRGCGSVRGHPP